MLVITFLTDFSTASRSDIADGPIPATMTVRFGNNQTETLDFNIRITPEGDVEIDDSLPDLVPDETDDPTPLTPADLLQPAATDRDGSEAIDTLTLTIDGLPANATLDSLNITLPNGATTQIAQDGATGATSLTITLNAQDVGDVNAAYDSIALSLPADFSTTNRSDLINGNTALPITLTLNVQTDEDQNPATDTPTDGTATAQRSVDIEDTPDISLQAPRLLIAAEDDGIDNSDQGVTVDLNLNIDITDQDGSETADPTDPRFAATVTIRYVGLPDGTTASTGTLDDTTWSGTVEQANALSLALPGNYNGTILSLVSVTTPEGRAATPQAIRVTPTPDIVIDGTVTTTETDAPLEILLAAFISVLVTDPDEDITALNLSLPGLPQGMAAQTADGTPVGTFTPDANGTLTFSLNLSTDDNIDPRDVRLIFPTDYSTQTPATTLTADLTVTTTDGQATGQIPLQIAHEGDIDIADATLQRAETDDPVLFTPADSITPVAIDLDGSETIAQLAVTFNALPDGTRISTDGGATFQDLDDPTLSFIGTLEAYQNLVIALPADFSTANPQSTLFADIAAITNEGGTGQARLDITLTAPAQIAATEDGDGIDGAGVTVNLGITVAATDLDGSEDSTTVQIAFTGLPDGTTASTGTLNGPAWTGTMAQANALSLTLPGDYSGTINTTITALSPEGQTSTNQTLTIAPAGDVDLNIQDLVTAETDDPLTISPAQA